MIVIIWMEMLKIMPLKKKNNNEEKKYEGDNNSLEI